MHRVQDDPVTALKLVGSTTALSVGQTARALDNIIAAIDDDAKARVLIEEHVTLAVQAQSVAAWGDRASALAQLADPDVLASSLVSMCEGGDVSLVAAVIRGLALQNHDRADWDEVLAHELPDGYSLGDLLIVAVAAEVEPVTARGPETSLRPPDAWVNVGLHPDEAEERLHELQEGNTSLLISISQEGLFTARVTLAARREQQGLPVDTGLPEDV
jgi:hypothetical protein